MDISKNITVDFEEWVQHVTLTFHLRLLGTLTFHPGETPSALLLEINIFLNALPWTGILFCVLTRSSTWLFRFELLSLETDNSEVVVEDVNVEKMTDVLDYDAEVSIFDREDFLNALLKTGGVSAKVAKVQGQVTGYIVNTKDSILQCYGENETAQKYTIVLRKHVSLTNFRALFASAAANMSPKVSMYVRKETGQLMDQLSQVKMLCMSPKYYMCFRTPKRELQWPDLTPVSSWTLSNTTKSLLSIWDFISSNYF